ncbi:MAG: 6-phosphofructokinase [Firmicutes bacterium]|nr:6-phosphofructokinase [Bacillota bacterium]
MMGKGVKRIGVLTGGGDCPGLNAVIRAVVKTAVNRYDLEVMGINDGFEGLIHGWIKPLTPADVVGILPRGGTILGTTNRANPFQYPWKDENGVTRPRDCTPIILDNLAKYGIEALVVIGGDGSLKVARELAQQGVKIVGVPKTIDNDLNATDVTFGFDTAVNTATEALDKLHTTAESHHRVMVLEVMGRYAGWIALEAGLAGGADVILIPEIPYDLSKVCAKIMSRTEQGKKFSIVVVAEGAAPKGGSMVVSEYVNDTFDPVRLGGIGKKVAQDIAAECAVETRSLVLGHLQRGGSPSAFDRILATRFGAAAVKLVVEGRFGRMVCLRTPNIDSVDLDEAVREMKRVDPEGDLVYAAKSVGICFGD